MAQHQAASQVARFILGDGGPISGYVFSHPRLRELYLEKLLSESERTEFQQRFVCDGQAWYGKRAGPPAVYLRQFWIAHLMESGEWELARRVLTEMVPVGAEFQQPWAAARFAAEGSYTGYLSDLHRLWSWADQHNDLILGLRCALIASSIRSLSHNLRPGLLVGLVKVGTPAGRWSGAAALEHIRHIPDPVRQAMSLEALLKNGCDLPSSLALAVTRAITGEDARARALVALAPHLPEAQQAGVYAEALDAARAITYGVAPAQTLVALAPHLPEGLLAEALDAARAFTFGRDRARALVALAPHLPEGLLAEALDAARATTNEVDRARALVALAPHLPGAQQAGVYAEALDGARAITDLSERAWVLEALAPHLAVLSRAITVTNNITAEWQESVCILAASGRPALLNGLKALMPWLVTLARPPMLREIAVTIRDVSRCWP